MQVVKECMHVTIEYDMKVIPPGGDVVENGRQRCGFVYGVDVQYPSVERALAGKAPGDRVLVRVPPDEIFGCHDSSLVRELPREDYKQERLREGRVYREMKKKCLVQFLVRKLEENTILADFNDPRAGTEAEFDIVVKEVRDATKTELQPSCAKVPDYDSCNC